MYNQYLIYLAKTVGKKKKKKKTTTFHSLCLKAEFINVD